MSHNYIDLTVRSFHLDTFAHVNNARYLEFLEEARWHVFGKALKRLFDHNLSLTIANININYRYSAQIHQKIRVTAELARFGNTSFVISQKVFDPDNPEIVFADAAVTLVILDKQNVPFALDESTKRTIFAECYSA